ncbi:MAG TPA: hypothetical protein VKE98_20770 [Gemmataceae bacterium]|nr:hypothetical protein [Gemmataceae bacterium]
MPRGGARPCPNNGGKRTGAGRKPNAATQRTSKTTAIAEKAAGEGVLPLQVMLEAMRAHYAAGDLDRAAAFAKDAAPYQHPRKQAITVEGGATPLEVRVLRDRDFYGTADRLSAGGT